MHSNKVKAFTLFELLIVVSIIGIVYTLFTQKLNIAKKPESVTLENFIPWTLKKSFEKKASIVCLIDERDKGCRLYLDNLLQKDIKLMLFDKDDNIKVFRPSGEDFLEVSFLSFMGEENIQNDIFFKLDIIVNGGYQTTVIQKNDSFFFYNSYSKVLIFDSLSDIEDYLWKQRKILNDK